MGAAKLISFSPRGGTASAPVFCAKEAAEPVRNPRYRGLHLVAAGTLASSLPDDTQTQASRIVAQVEWEIEQQAVRECQHTFQMLHKDIGLSAVQTLDSPITIAQRLMNALR